VPEIASGSVEIKAVAREAGSRTKIAVYSGQLGVDPVGSCVGQKGVRVQAVINELGDEKIDVDGRLFRAFAKPLHQRKLLSVIRKEINIAVNNNQSINLPFTP